jgi:FkbM family methyltransferase
MSSNSYFFKISKKIDIFKKIYILYNIYIRNFQYHFINSQKNSQFGEEKHIFKHFNKNFKGKFLDIGCFHPTRNNNTYKMYKKGWRGMNIDLNPLSIELFNVARPRDINICTAVSDKIKKVDLFFIGDLDTKNTIERNHAKLLNKTFLINNSKIKKTKIRTRKLEDILKKYDFFDIDFMNLDIEGHELNVLKNLNFKKIKIKVICIEMINHDRLSKAHNGKILKILKKNGYILKNKISVNHIFKLKEKITNTR